MSAVRRRFPPPSSDPPSRLRTIVSRVRFVSRAVVAAMCAAVLAGAVSSCRETTAAPLRYPVLDDQGHGDWRSVSVGADHTCGLKTDGTAFCWGSNRYGQL